MFNFDVQCEAVVLTNGQFSYFFSKRNSVSFVSLWLKGCSKMFSNSKAILALFFKVDKAKRKFVI